MKKPDFEIVTPALQKEISDIEKEFEKDEFTYSIEEYNFCESQLLEAGQLTPELKNLVTTNMSEILHNIQNIINEVSQAHTQEIEENYKLAQHNLEKIVEQYNEELIETKRELNKMHQNVAIYKNEINKLMRLIYARNCLIEKLAKDIQELQKQQKNSGAAISSKILF